MRDKNVKESTVTRWVDDQGQQQIVKQIFVFLHRKNDLRLFL